MLIVYQKSGTGNSEELLANPTDAGQLSFYEYVRSDPVNMMDPTGLEAVKYNQPIVVAFPTNDGHTDDIG